MNKLSAEQRAAVSNFREFTGSSIGQAIKCLELNRWNVELAANDFFMNPPSPEPEERVPQAKWDESGAKALFDKYRDAEREEATITFDGIEAMCADIGVDANDLAVFIFAWHCQAATLGEFAWDEFRRGAEELHIDSLAKFKERVETMRAELVDPVAFKRFYVFVFQYGREGIQKSLDLDSAIELWKILLVDKFPNLGLWCEFLKSDDCTTKAISKDVWELLLEFATQVNSTFSNYDSDGAWPSVVDSFVEWAQERRKGQ